MVWSGNKQVVGPRTSTQGGLENVGVGEAGGQVADYQIQEVGRRNSLSPRLEAQIS